MVVADSGELATGLREREHRPIGQLTVGQRPFSRDGLRDSALFPDLHAVQGERFRHGRSEGRQNESGRTMTCWIL